MAETTVEQAVTWAAFETDLKLFLGVSGSAEDTNLQLWLGAATATADLYLERTFEYSVDPAAELPRPIVLGCFAFVQYARSQASIDPNLTGVKTAQLQETYANPGGSGMTFRLAGHLLAARVHWDPYKLRAELASGLL